MQIIKFNKNFLVATLIASSILTHKNINSFILIRTLNHDHEMSQTGISYHINLPQNFKTIVAVSAIATCLGYIGYVGTKAYTAYTNGIEQYEILKEFETNQNYTYEQLKIDASNLYYAQCPNSSPKSVDSDYPVVWFVDQVTKNSKYLSKFFFIGELNKLGDKLYEKLTLLRNHVEFKKEKIEYSEKHRQINCK
jgi:hypothetical protein